MCVCARAYLSTTTTSAAAAAKCARVCQLKMKIRQAILL